MDVHRSGIKNELSPCSITIFSKMVINANRFYLNLLGHLRANPVVWFLSQNIQSKVLWQAGDSARAPKAEKNSMVEIRGVGNNIMMISNLEVEDMSAGRNLKCVEALRLNIKIVLSGAPPVLVTSHLEAASTDTLLILHLK